MKHNRVTYDNKRGLIIIGYQGIGKTSIANARSNIFMDGPIVDLDSSLFYVDDERDPKWFVTYCKQTVALARQGFTVCVSSHKEVCDELVKYDSKKDFDIWMIYPSFELENEWVEKLHDRFFETNSDKDYRAYMSAYLNYREEIERLTGYKTFQHSPLKSMEYDLREIVDIIRDLCKVRHKLSMMTSNDMLNNCKKRIDFEIDDCYDATVHGG